MKRIFLLVIVITILVGCASMGPESKWEKDYQLHADQTRMRDILKIADIINEYYDKTGYYPLANGNYDLPLAVAITDKKEYVKPGYIDKELFIKEIKTIMGQDINIPMDPQKYDVYGARLYLYSTDGKDFQLSARLFNPSPGTKPLEKYVHVFLINGKSVHKDRYSPDSLDDFLSFANSNECIEYGNVNIIDKVQSNIISFPFIVMNKEKGGEPAMNFYPFTQDQIAVNILKIISANYKVIPDEMTGSGRYDKVLDEFIPTVFNNAGNGNGSPLKWGINIEESGIDENTYIYLPIATERETEQNINARFYVLIANSKGAIIYSSCLPYNPLTWSSSNESFNVDTLGKLPLTN